MLTANQLSEDRLSRQIEAPTGVTLINFHGDLSTRTVRLGRLSSTPEVFWVPQAVGVALALIFAQYWAVMGEINQLQGGLSLVCQQISPAIDGQRTDDFDNL